MFTGAKYQRIIKRNAAIMGIGIAKLYAPNFNRANETVMIDVRRISIIPITAKTSNLNDDLIIASETVDAAEIGAANAMIETKPMRSVP
jgi:hypothetical protein